MRAKLTDKHLNQELRSLREKLAALKRRLAEIKPVGLAAYETEKGLYTAKSPDLFSEGVGWFCESP